MQYRSANPLEFTETLALRAGVSCFLLINAATIKHPQLT
jgi:hypothetical protein